MASLKKQELLQSTLSFLETTSHFALIKFDRTPHLTLEQLRRELKKNGAQLKVIKTSLFDKALQKMAEKKMELHPMVKHAVPVKESTAIISLGEEWNSGLSAFQKFAEKEKSLSFKAGFLDNTTYDKTQLERIATLPGKDQLIAKILGGMQSPSTHFVYALKFNMQKFAYILSERSKQA
ncbi:50S ribosomal protein L10 [Candidatus Roizmanbacteria bacterium]|nr:50S ribosomal protein L10 [Candidatus Roizmanbacteria bacterium]